MLGVLKPNIWCLLHLPARRCSLDEDIALPVQSAKIVYFFYLQDVKAEKKKNTIEKLDSKYIMMGH